MEILFFLIPIALMFSLGALFLFIKATNSGQFDDFKTPSQSVLIEDMPLKDTAPQTQNFSETDNGS